MASAAARGGGRVCLGVVAGAHGVRGQVRIRPYTGEPGDVAAYGAVTTADGRSLDLKVTGVTARGLVLARIAGIRDRDAAEALRGAELHVRRDRLPPAGPDAFYCADLVGLAVRDAGGRRLGTVTAVHDFGAGTVLEAGPAPGGALRRAIMLPFTCAVVPDVDLEAGIVTVAPPAGLLDGETDLG